MARASGKPRRDFDLQQLLPRESVAMLAHHGCGCMVGQSGCLLGGVTLGHGLQEAACKHVTRTIGVHCFDGDCGDMQSLAQLQNFAALRTHGQANCLGQVL